MVVSPIGERLNAVTVRTEGLQVGETVVVAGNDVVNVGGGVPAMATEVPVPFQCHAPER
jgi:hypothetical protein